MNIPGYAAIISAICSIPQAIKAARDMLAGKAPDVAAISARLADIEEALRKYAGARTWFSEAKELHDNVVHVENALAPAFTETARAYDNVDGKFSPDGFEFSKVRKAWMQSAYTRTNLRSFATSSRELFECVELDGSGKPTAGAAWLRDFFEIEARIEALFRKADKRVHIEPKLKQELCGLMGYVGGMQSATVNAVGKANGLIRGLAEHHAVALEALAGGLK